MEQKKAVWTYEDRKLFGTGIYKDGVRRATLESVNPNLAENITSRLNDTEGLNTEALPELIALVKDTKIFLMNKYAESQDILGSLAYKNLAETLQSALDKLTGGKK